MTAFNRRGAMALALLALGLLSCAKADPIGQAIQSAKDRSVPLGGRLIPLYGPTREEDSIKASWEIETSMAWGAYAAWVASQLPEFQVRQQDGEVVRLSRPLEADAYALTFRPRPGDNGLKVEATFESRPF